MADKAAGEALLRTLNRAGYRACFVGGCVRDSLLGRPVHDWDITTAARPEEVMALFPHCVPTGIAHGTVTVLWQGGSFEVTTFRTEGDYSDGRHPDAVAFVADLEGDLARRDFTVNAMAMDADGTVTDLYGGQADLRAGILRCVGDPVRRFNEDALRILRAVRFSAQLGFYIEPATARAMVACAPLCRKLSAERVRDEMEKTLLSPRPQDVLKMLDLGMLEAFDLFPWTAGPWINTAAPERAARWTALKLALPALDLERLRLDGKTVRLCEAAAAAYVPVVTMPYLKRLTAREGWDVAECVCRVAGEWETMEELKRSGHCVTLEQLAVKGRDLKELRGPAVGAALRRMLEHVLDHPKDNEKSRLLEWLSRSEAEKTGNEEHCK